MAEAPALPLRGPPQRGDGVKGQYVYALIMPQPTPEVLERTGVKQPSDFDRTIFREMVVKCLAEVRGGLLSQTPASIVSNV
jgi:hypothetical protein